MTVNFTTFRYDAVMKRDKKTQFYPDLLHYKQDYCTIQAALE